jgi:hypothetical protein
MQKQDFTEAIARELAKAPPLSDEQRNHITALLRAGKPSIPQLVAA